MLISMVTMVVVAYAAFGLALFFLQRSILYHPDLALGTPESYRLQGFATLTLTSDDGLPLTVWSFPAAAGMPTVLYYHGNAGNLGMRSEVFGALAAAGFGVEALSYRGFGTSGGTPTEAGLYADARLLLKHARMTLHLADDHLILFGESLGSGVAVQMATEMTPAMLVLESPYTSIVRRGQALYPYMPVRLLLRDRFDSIAKMDKVKAPVLIFHGARDQVIPISDGRAMLAAANEPKRGLFYDEYAHVDFPGALLAEEILRYHADLGTAPPLP